MELDEARLGDELDWAMRLLINSSCSEEKSGAVVVRTVVVGGGVVDIARRTAVDGGLRPTEFLPPRPCCWTVCWRVAEACS